jgi:glycerol-3-phosphate O-acyltransferase
MHGTAEAIDGPGRVTDPTFASDDRAKVVLADARSVAERGLIALWATAEHAGAEVIYADDGRLAARLGRGDDPLVVPARVTWLASGDPGATPSSLVGDLAALFRPRRPPGPLQSWIIRRDPKRARVTAGEPARAVELRREFRAETGSGGDAAALAAFVVHRAAVSCDRVERTLIGERYKVPRLVADQIAASSRVRKRVADLADDLERPFDGVLGEVTTALQELVAVQSPPAIDAFRAAMGPLHRRAWSVDADSASLEQLREAARLHALVFLPSHRSYADPLVLADVLHRYDFPRNHVLGGNNMAFWPIGPLGRRAGMIFIRRSFGADAVYKLAVREYFGYLVSKRFNLEWYIEGGRSRTGKLGPPRYGLLRYLVRALEDGHSADVTLVPTSLVYEQLHEVGSMAAEQRGAAKPAEGLAWLVRYVRAQSRDAGTVRVRFGEPLSLRKALADAGEGRAQLEKVAFRICVEINRATPVAATSLVTFALLGVRDRALTLTQVRRVIAPLLDHLDARGIPGPADDLRLPGPVNRILSALERAGVVASFGGGVEPVWRVAPGHQHVAAFYRNGALHHTVNRAVVELALLRCANGDNPADAVERAWTEALALRDLLKFEFFFPRKSQYREELLGELEMLGWDLGGIDDTAAARLLATAPLLVAHGTLRSFVDAQLIVASRLAARDPRGPIDRDAFLRECLGYGRQLVFQGIVHGEESISRTLFESALRLAANRDLLDPGREELDAARAAWREELISVLADLDCIAAIDAARLETVIDAGA